MGKNVRETRETETAAVGRACEYLSQDSRFKRGLLGRYSIAFSVSARRLPQGTVTGAQERGAGWLPVRVRSVH